MDQQQPNPNTSLFQMNLDANGSPALRSLASWAKILGVVGIIIALLFVVSGILVQNTMSNTYRGDEAYRGISGARIGAYGMAVYIFMGILFLISSIFVISGGNKLSAALKSGDQASLNSGFAGIRNYLAFWAVLIIIFLVLMVIGLVGGSAMR